MADAQVGVVMADSAEIAPPSMGQWAHDIADQYDDLADREGWSPRRLALRAAAAKYRGIGRRMDGITRPIQTAPGAAS